MEQYLTYDYMEGAATLENHGNGYADGYMYWDNLEIFPILELIVKYINIIFKDGRKYIVGKGVLSLPNDPACISAKFNVNSPWLVLVLTLGKFIVPHLGNIWDNFLPNSSVE